MGLRKIPHLRELIEKNKQQVVNCISCAARKWALQETNRENQKIADLRNDILAIPYHIFGDHSRCGSVI